MHPKTEVRQRTPIERKSHEILQNMLALYAGTKAAKSPNSDLHLREKEC